jgi:transglycosylase-like protein
VALVGLAAGLVSVGAPGGQLSADPLAPARANAAALSRRVLQEAQLVHQRTVRYQVESARAGLLGDELASSEASAQALRWRAGQTESLLRQEALLSYADALPAVGAGGQSSRDLMEATDQATYLALTVGDISGTLDLLKSEQSQLARTVATSRLELQSAIEAESSAAQARLLALREAASLQVLLSRAESQVAALTSAERASAERAPTGPPVGDGIVKALAQQLGATPANPRPTSIGASPRRAATAAVTAALAKRTHKAASTRKAALSNGPRTRATTTAELATTTRTTTVLRPTTTTGRPTTTTDGPTTTTGPPTTTTGGRPVTSTEARPTTTTTTTAAGAVGAAARTPPPSSTTTPSTTTPTSKTTTSTTTTSTTTTTDPPAPPTTPATTTPATTTPPATTAATTADVHPPPAGGLWLELRECESGDNYQADTGNGYYGAYQFSWATWVDLGYPGRPDQEPYWMQDEAAQRLEAMDGWGQWPSCSTALGV